MTSTLLTEQENGHMERSSIRRLEARPAAAVSPWGSRQAPEAPDSWWNHCLQTTLNPPQVALQGLGRVYKTIQEDGVVDIGLQATLHVGVPESGYVPVPRCILKSIELGEDVEVAVAGNTASGKTQSKWWKETEGTCTRTKRLNMKMRPRRMLNWSSCTSSLLKEYLLIFFFPAYLVRLRLFVC